MSFISTFKQIRLFKKGRKAAISGNLREAVLFLNKASQLSVDLKSKYENLTWLHLCEAIKYTKENNLLMSKQSYKEFKLVHQLYTETCNSTPGFGTETRYQVWLNGIKEMYRIYSLEISALIG